MADAIGIDFSAAQIDPQAIKAAGVTAVINYVSEARPSASWMKAIKPLSREYADRLRAAGIEIVSGAKMRRSDLVSHVVRDGSQQKVSRINATPIVASVPDQQSIGNGAVDHLPSEPVRIENLGSHAYSAVPDSRMNVSLPVPARTVRKAGRAPTSEGICDRHAIPGLGAYWTAQGLTFTSPFIVSAAQSTREQSSPTSVNRAGQIAYHKGNTTHD